MHVTKKRGQSKSIKMKLMYIFTIRRVIFSTEQTLIFFYYLITILHANPSNHNNLYLHLHTHWLNTLTNCQKRKLYSIYTYSSVCWKRWNSRSSVKIKIVQ